MYSVASFTPGFDEPLAMLEACHAHIEARLGALEKLCSHLDRHGADPRARAAARGLVRYFDSEGVQHHRDEDEDLFPLLRRLAAQGGRAEIAAVINDLEREHATMDVQWSRLRPQLDGVVHGRGARLDPDDVTRFAWLYRSHIEREALAVLPFAKEALTAPQRAVLGGRMKARRKAI